MVSIKKEERQVTATDGSNLESDQKLAIIDFRNRYLDHFQTSFAENLSG
jgi:hypothetical protein